MKAREIAGASQLKEEKPRFIMKRQASNSKTHPWTYYMYSSLGMRLALALLM